MAGGRGEGGCGKRGRASLNSFPLSFSRKLVLDGSAHDAGK